MMIPNAVYIRAYRSRGMAGRLIRWFTFGDYSHVSLVFAFGSSAMEYESIQGSGVIAHEPSQGKEFDLFSVPLTNEQIQEAWHWVKHIRGKYDWGGVWGFVRRKARHSDSKWFCSEFVAYVLLKAGYPLSRRDPYRETPTTTVETLRIDPVEDVGGA